MCFSSAMLMNLCISFGICLSSTIHCKLSVGMDVSNVRVLKITGCPGIIMFIAHRSWTILYPSSLSFLISEKGMIRNRTQWNQDWGQRTFVIVQSLSHVRFFAIPWTVAHQAPLSMGFFRQEYWNGLPFPSPGDPHETGIQIFLLL